MRAVLSAICLAILAAFGADVAAAQSGFVPNPPQGAKWCQHAEAFLFNRAQKRAFRCATDRTPHCVKLSNYGCVKHGPGNPYAGTPAPNGKQGAHDGRDGARGHAIFEHPKWSVAASFRWFEKSHKELGLKTAAKLANRYSPWCDTHGSGAVKRDAETGRRWGRTCTDGQRPPPGFSGPLCKEPAAGAEPSKEQCRVCNCPSVFVKSWLKDTTFKPTDTLALFAADGKPTKLMEQILVNHTPWEIGYKPSDALVAEGAQLFVPKQ